jgi:hypothetical protein
MFQNHGHPGLPSKMVGGQEYGSNLAEVVEGAAGS